MVNVGIIGAGGYAGETLISILLRHPKVKINWLISEEAHKGKKIAELYPHLFREMDLSCQTLEDLDRNLENVDLVFLALPHGIAMNYVPKILEVGKKVIDLGADYRFAGNELFEKWYHIKHPSESYLKEAVYGLPEIYRERIKRARLIGNPGCYPTASILGAVPLVKSKINFDFIVIDAKSGFSGAGRGISLKAHFCERNEGIEAYAVATHRHLGEIEDQLSQLAGKDLKITFVPHLVPMNRGILASIYIRISQQIKKEALLELYKDFYKQEPFVRILENGLPNTKYVSGTNYCDIAVQYDESNKMIIVLSAIDNLVKGAAGQAVQNMNIIYGWPEEEGLRQVALYP